MFAPIPSASVVTAISANPGLRTSILAPKRRSCQNASIIIPLLTALWWLPTIFRHIRTTWLRSPKRRSASRLAPLGCPALGFERLGPLGDVGLDLPVYVVLHAPAPEEPPGAAPPFPPPTPLHATGDSRTWAMAST